MDFSPSPGGGSSKNASTPASPQLITVEQLLANLPAVPTIPDKLLLKAAQRSALDAELGHAISCLQGRIASLQQMKESAIDLR